MRGIPISKTSIRDFDFIVIAARYKERDGNLEIAQVYERRGPIWGDVKLLERTQLLDLIKSGRKIVVGDLAELPGDFITSGSVKISMRDGSEFIHVGEGSPSHDDLKVPLF